MSDPTDELEPLFDYSRVQPCDVGCLDGLVVSTFCYLQFFPPPFQNDVTEKGESSIFRSLSQAQLLKALSLRNGDCRSLVHVAASSGHAEVVKMLSVADPSVSGVNSTDDEGWAPLHSASSGGKVEIVDILLSGGESNAQFTEAQVVNQQTDRDNHELISGAGCNSSSMDDLESGRRYMLSCCLLSSSFSSISDREMSMICTIAY